MAARKPAAPAVPDIPRGAPNGPKRDTVERCAADYHSHAGEQARAEMAEHIDRYGPGPMPSY